MGEGTAGGKTYTEEEVQGLIEERNRALEAKRDEILGELKRAKDQLRAYDGLDAEAARKAQARLAELEQQAKGQKAGLNAEEVERLRRDVRADLEKEYAPLKDRADALGKEVRTLRLDNNVKALMAKHGVLAHRVDALFRLTADQFDLSDDGQPILKAYPGREPGKYIADEVSKEFPEFFAGSGSSGGGAPKSAAGGGTVRQIAAGDNAAFLANLDGVAKGTVRVAE